MTVVSVVFSITMAALAQMSSQFGPRVLRNFTGDRGTQLTLGTFIATFIYCLMVLRTVRDVEESTFAPHLSVTIGFGLSVASLAVLIYFIHHVSQSMQVEHLIAEVGHEFQNLLPVIFPERIAHEQEHATSPAEIEAYLNWDEACTVSAMKNGYLQRVDHVQLMKVATGCDLVVHLERHPGDFVSQGMVLVRDIPSPLRYDDDGNLRVVAYPLQFDQLAAAAIDQIRLYASNNALVLVHLVNCIGQLTPHLQREEDRQALLHHLTRINEDSVHITNDHDRAQVAQAIQRAVTQLSVVDATVVDATVEDATIE